MGHEEVILVQDAAAGLRAVIALHDTTLGPAVGGIILAVFSVVAGRWSDRIRPRSRIMLVTAWLFLLGAYPSLEIGPLLDSHKHDIGAILRESLETEGKALALYRELLRCAEGRSVALEEYARQMVYAEELHASEVDKMLRTPGEVAAFEPNRRCA